MDADGMAEANLKSSGDVTWPVAFVEKQDSVEMHENKMENLWKPV